MSRARLVIKKKYLAETALESLGISRYSSRGVRDV